MELSLGFLDLGRIGVKLLEFGVTVNELGLGNFFTKADLGWHVDFLN